MTVIETEIVNAIKPILAPYLQNLDNHKFDIQPHLIEVKVQQDDSELTRATLLRVNVVDERKEVRISSIVMPEAMKGQGLGKALIKAIYIPAKAHGYEVFITDMTPGFYQRLLRRGARSCDGETVQINDDTVLA